MRLDINKTLFGFVLYAFSCVIFPPSVWAGSFDDFFTAIARDDVETLRQLQQRGFDLNTRDAQYRPPLTLALAKDAFKVAGFLIDQPGFDLEARNESDENGLMLAALKGRPDLIRALLNRQAQVNKPGWTPLHYAATHSGPSAPELVRVLLEHHAYIDAESPNGSTPLMMAAHYGNPVVVKVLLEEGADPGIKNHLGLSAIDFAYRAGRKEAAEIIGAFVRGKQPRGSW